MSDNTYPKILSKSPCNDDLFKDASHRKLAGIIADEIRNDENCTIIGIDGGWGSGKSNLVGLIKKELHKSSLGDEKYHFFTYDAWAHQNDIHRRTILEELIADLIDDKTCILDSQSWKLALQQLLAKSKTTNKKVVPSIGLGVIISGILILLTPILNWVISFIPTEWLKPIILLLPYILVYFIYGRNHIRKMKDKYKQEFTWETALSEFFIIYQDKVKEDVTYEIISEREPSSREFRNWIHKVNQGLRDNNDKVLLLVFDNMDRMPKSKVQELWATILSFFSEEKYSNIRIIVPFDRSHIKNAFQSEDISQCTDNDKNILASYGNDFINKTFYIVYHVSPPILSGWKDYFRQQWACAFGPTLPLDDKVLQIYDLLTSEQTPRKIIAFINEFVTIKQYADPIIPPEYIALFIFGKDKISVRPMEEIIKPEYLGSLDFLYGDDEKMMGYISSLYYQLDYESAVDVVFVEKFRQELDSYTPQTIRLMKEKGGDKFWSILNNSIVRVQNIANASYLLDDVFGGDESERVHHLWECLYRLFKKNCKEKTVYQDFHKLMLSHIDEDIELRDRLLADYASFVTSDKFVLEDYCNGIDSIASAKEIETYEELQECKMECSPFIFVNLVELKKDNWDKYGLIVGDDVLDDYLVSLKDLDIQQLNAIPYIKNDIKLPKYRKFIEERIKSDTLNEELVKLYLNRLSDFKEYPININKYLIDSEINSLFASTTDEKFRTDLIAMRLSRLSEWSVASHRDNFSAYVASTDSLLISIISEIILKYINYGNILLGLSSFDSLLFKSIARHITINGGTGLKLNLQKVLYNFDKIIENSDIDEYELLTRLNNWDCGIISSESIVNMPYKLFEASYNHLGLSLSLKVREIVEEYLGNITQEQWKKALADKNSFNYKLLVLHNERIYTNCSDALKSLLKEYALGQLSSINKDVIEEILKIQSRHKKSLSVYFTPLRTLYINEEAVMSVEKFKVLGRWLFEYAALNTKEQSLQHIIPTEILSDVDVLSLVCRYGTIISDMVKNSPVSVSSEFKEKLHV